MAQNYTSANTSINKSKLPAIYNKVDWERLLNQVIKKGGEPNILDIGAGKYTEHIKEYCKTKGFNYYAYDKYNGSSKKWNKIIPALVICSNVLNVIDDNEVNKQLHKSIIDFKTPYFITVYEGDKSGVGKVTMKDCYQRNEKLSKYKLFDEIIYKNVLTKEEYKWYIK